MRGRGCASLWGLSGTRSSGGQLALITVVNMAAPVVCRVWLVSLACGASEGRVCRPGVLYVLPFSTAFKAGKARARWVAGHCGIDPTPTAGRLCSPSCCASHLSW